MSQPAETPNQPSRKAAGLQPFSLHGSIHVLLSEDAEPAVREFASACGWSRTQVRADRPAPLDRLLEAADALVVWVSDGTLPVLEMLTTLPEYPERPAVIAVTDEAIPAEAAADFIALPQSWMIQSLLRTALETRARYLAEVGRAQAAETRLQEFRRRESELDSVRSELELARSAITNNFAHEVGTPLLQIKTVFIELKGRLPEEKMLIDFADQAIGRMQRFISDIRMLADGLDAHIQPVIAQDIVKYALRERSRYWNSQSDGNRVQFLDECGDIIIEGDYRGLSLVLQHLIDNAIKFDRSGAPVYVRLTRIQNAVRFSVEDRGQGIPPRLRERIFEPYFQIESDSRRSSGGAGLGLALVKMILDKHGAQILLKSDAGAGTIFSFELPVVQSSP